jgi:hypothetical protein
MLLLSPSQDSTKLATHISLVTIRATAMFINVSFSYYSRRSLALHLECSTFERRYTTVHDLVAATSENAFLSPLPRLQPTLPITCSCADPLSRLILVEVTLGVPITEVQIFHRH